MGKWEDQSAMVVPWPIREYETHYTAGDLKIFFALQSYKRTTPFMARGTNQAAEH
jgi:hypothetical protein